MPLRTREVRLPAEYHKAKEGSVTRRMFAAGVPEKYVKLEPEAIPNPNREFPTTDPDTDLRKMASVTKQSKQLQRIFHEKGVLGSSRLIVVASSPTEEWAMAVGAAIMRQAFNREIKREMLDASNPIPDRLNAIVIPSVVVLHNITHESSASRIDKLRDWIKIASNSTCVVCVSGSDPRTFCDERLRMAADAEFYFRGRFKPRKVIRT